MSDLLSLPHVRIIGGVLLCALWMAAAGAGATEAIPLTAAQTERLRDHVVRENVEPFAGAVGTGERLPLAADLHPLPGSVTMELPVLRTLRYVRLPSGFALVDPDTRLVERLFSAAPAPPAP